MAPANRAGEDLSMRRRRLRYRAWRRGTRELDLILGPFADATLARMSEAELERLERLLDLDETALQQWLLGQVPPPPDT
ncbi:MAG TPA: succinate dehydrogenase assembly factor 2, partial [Alphaproteobacteria bacterium]|nr:succinate dehydrogenase assembly factor 2 [Alphaproteobacteria bacterium]